MRINWYRINAMILVPTFFWIGMVWAPIWTGFLLLLALGAMCLGIGLDKHFNSRIEEWMPEKGEDGRELTPAEIDEIDAHIINLSKPWPHG